MSAPILIHVRDYEYVTDDFSGFVIDVDLVFTAEGDGLLSSRILDVRGSSSGKRYGQSITSGEDARLLEQLVESDEVKALVDAEIERRLTVKAKAVVRATFAALVTA